MKYLLLAFPILFSFLVNSQITEQSLGHQQEKFATYIPDGYFIHTVTEGNLNLDSIPDAILVLAPNGEDSLSNYEHPLNRKVYILTGKQDGSYELAAESDQAIYYYMFDANFLDAFADLYIKEGIFTISFYGGFRARWYRDIAFKYDETKKDWHLIIDDRGTFDALEEDESLNTETILTEADFGYVSFSEFNVYE